MSDPDNQPTRTPILDELISMNSSMDQQNQKIDALRTTFETGLHQIALIPVSIVFAAIFTGLFYLKMIEQWLWATFMLILMFPYFGDGITKIMASGMPWAKQAKAITVLLWLGITMGVAGCAGVFEPYVHVDQDGYDAGAKGTWTGVANQAKIILQPKSSVTPKD